MAVGVDELHNLQHQSMEIIDAAVDAVSCFSFQDMPLDENPKAEVHA
jgi:hypothetical protein